MIEEIKETVEQLNDTVIENAEELNVSDSDTVEEDISISNGGVPQDIQEITEEIKEIIDEEENEVVTQNNISDFDILSSQIIEILNRTPSTDYCFVQAKKTNH